MANIKDNSNLKYCGKFASLAEEDAEIARYIAYFDSIKTHLPPDFLLFADRRNFKVPLNDGKIQSLSVDLARGEIVMSILGDAFDEAWKIIGGRMFQLEYKGVSQVLYSFNGSMTSLHSGDHLFDELELLAGNQFEHRMLFDGFEIGIIGREFSLNWNDTLI